ncbi:hypothetical protein CI1B_25410 [Bradyrhizobium ivorense]|uniref:Uncharacterized protein n=1 Tax=Bradyrhizobium ivorense TaxID=2511166 RepID=A0A508T2C4_9BRAD|nr:hypothetical protein CI1B_25410 [Bradyrhizobium ivorense]
MVGIGRTWLRRSGLQWSSVGGAGVPRPSVRRAEPGIHILPYEILIDARMSLDRLSDRLLGEILGGFPVLARRAASVCESSSQPKSGDGCAKSRYGE